MSQQDINKLKSTVNELREKFEDLVVDFAGIRRLINERPAPDQVAKLEGLIEKATKLEPLLNRLTQFPQVPEPTPRESLQKLLDRYFPQGIPPGIDIDNLLNITMDYDERYLFEELKQKCRDMGLPLSGDKKILAAKVWLKESGYI